MVDSQESERSVSFDQLGDRRRSILETIRGLGGEANAAEIRQRTDVPKGSFGWHFGKLEEWSLLEDVGRQNVGGGDDAIVWSLTDAGADLLEEIDTELERGDETEPPVEAEEFADFEAELEELPFPATGIEVAAAIGDREIESVEGSYGIEDLVPETDAETFDSPAAAGCRYSDRQSPRP